MSESDQRNPAAEHEERERLRSRRFLAASLVLTATLFCGVVIGVMVGTRTAEGPAPPDLAGVDQLRLLVAQSPQDQALLETVRRADALLRARFWANRRRLAWVCRSSWWGSRCWCSLRGGTAP